MTGRSNIILANGFGLRLAVSFANHQTPEWFRDAKFGIRGHWAVKLPGSKKKSNGVPKQMVW